MDQQIRQLIRLAIAKQGNTADLLKLARALSQSNEFNRLVDGERPEYSFPCRLGPTAIQPYHAHSVVIVCESPTYGGRFDWEAPRETHYHECNLLPLQPFGFQSLFPGKDYAWLPYYATINSPTGYVSTLNALGHNIKILHEDIAAWVATNRDIMHQAEKDWKLFQAGLAYDRLQDALERVTAAEAEVADAIWKWLQTT